MDHEKTGIEWWLERSPELRASDIDCLRDNMRDAAAEALTEVEQLRDKITRLEGELSSHKEAVRCGYEAAKDRLRSLVPPEEVPFVDLAPSEEKKGAEEVK